MALSVYECRISRLRFGYAFGGVGTWEPRPQFHEAETGALMGTAAPEPAVDVAARISDEIAAIHRESS